MIEKKYICFMIDTPIVQSYFSYYVLDAFGDEGYQIELVDISPVTNIKAFKIVKEDLIDYSAPNVYLCKSYKEIDEIIDNMPIEAIVITSFGWMLPYYPIFSHLTKNKIRYGHMILNSCYELTGTVSIKERIAAFFRRLSLKYIADVVFRRLPKTCFNINNCSFLINNSYEEIEGYKKRFYCNKDTKFLVIHSNTYEEALKNKDQKPLLTTKYCLWLDSYIPYHPDLVSMNIKIEPEKYYNSLRKFFYWIQNTYGIQVVISAHPRSNYKLHPEAYDGFPVIKGNTCILVRDAEFVITAASTSFLYAVTYQKPFVFIYNDILNELLEAHISFIYNVSKEFNKQPINIDKFNGEKAITDRQLIVEQPCYFKSAKTYIKSNYNGTIDGISYKKTIINFLENEI